MVQWRVIWDSQPTGRRFASTSLLKLTTLTDLDSAGHRPPKALIIQSYVTERMNPGQLDTGQLGTGHLDTGQLGTGQLGTHESGKVGQLDTSI